MVCKPLVTDVMNTAGDSCVQYLAVLMSWAHTTSLAWPRRQKSATTLDICANSVTNCWSFY
jgi:hypothetical protein